MSVALGQQRVTTFDHLCIIYFCGKFKNRFTYYKDNGDDVDTPKSIDVPILGKAWM